MTATVPSQPLAPLTAFFLSAPDYVKITWTAPAANGAAIESYEVRIRTSDGVTFLTDAECDASDPTIMAQMYCIVFASTLHAAPFNLAWGSDVYATVTATNSLGTSTISPAGYGATIITQPDAPISLGEVVASRTVSTLGL